MATMEEGEDRDEFHSGDGRGTTALLQEANEKLVLANLRSQELREEAELAQAGAEKTARELEESERELRQVAEFRERLLGVVGHDLRAPLQAISMTADVLLRRDDLDAGTEQAALRIRKSASRMAGIISQLLDFTRAHLGGGLPLSPKPVNLEAICRPIIEELEIGRAPSPAFTCEFTGDLNGTWDAERLAQVVSNIAGNAVQHGARGMPISILAKDEGATVLLAVSNQGNPIPPDVLPFIFDWGPHAKRQLQLVSGSGSTSASRSCSRTGARLMCPPSKTGLRSPFSYLAKRPPGLDRRDCGSAALTG